MEKYLVSIIIPVYNVKPYLKEALDSVIFQTYNNLEILIIDDGSTDGSGKICDLYLYDSRVKVIHQENRGLSAARNTGLSLMTGSFVAFLDPDDAYYPDYISTMVAAMDDADLVISKFSSHCTKGKLKQKGEVIPSIFAGTYDRIYSLHALSDNQINVSVWNKLYRVELWKDIRFPEGHNFEDAAIAYEIIDRCKKVCVIDDLLYLHRKRSDSITGTLSWKNLDDRLLASSCVEKFIRSKTPEVFSEEQLVRGKTDHFKQLIRCYGKCFRIKDKVWRREALRAQILQSDMEVDDIRFRAALWMIRLFPKLFGIIYLLYLFFRVILTRIKLIR